MDRLKFKKKHGVKSTTMFTHLKLIHLFADPHADFIAGCNVYQAHIDLEMKYDVN
jgi:hypothetical protein